MFASSACVAALLLVLATAAAAAPFPLTLTALLLLLLCAEPPPWCRSSVPVRPMVFAAM